MLHLRWRGFAAYATECDLHSEPPSPLVRFCGVRDPTDSHCEATRAFRVDSDSHCEAIRALGVDSCDLHSEPPSPLVRFPNLAYCI